MTMHDSEIGMRLDHMPARTRAMQTHDAHHDVTAPNGTARGRRLRNWLIVGNLMGWVVLILVARALLS